MTAPVCHISPPVQFVQPPAPRLPSIPTPQANDMQSLVNSIMALKQFVELLAGQRGQPSNNVASSSGAGSKSVKTQKDPNKSGRWNELSRQTEEVKVTNPDDSSQFVKVKRINRLVMQDSVTGEQWVWSSGSV